MQKQWNENFWSPPSTLSCRTWNVDNLSNNLICLYSIACVGGALLCKLFSSWPCRNVFALLMWTLCPGSWNINRKRLHNFQIVAVWAALGRILLYCFGCCWRYCSGAVLCFDAVGNVNIQYRKSPRKHPTFHPRCDNTAGQIWCFHSWVHVWLR